MTSLVFYNNSLDMNRVWFDSHKALIMQVCIELNCMDRFNELTKKYLGEPVKLKKVKDPSKPKRSRSAFFYFCDEYRPDLMKACTKEHGKISVGIISKQLGTMWGVAKDRQKWDELAAEDKVRYREEMETWNNKIN